MGKKSIAIHWIRTLAIDVAGINEDARVAYTQTAVQNKYAIREWLEPTSRDTCFSFVNTNIIANT